MPTTPKSLDRPNVLVTGGAGFIGSNLCAQLLEKNNVICVDNYLSGLESNIDALLLNPHFLFIRHDLTQPLDFKSYPGAEKFKLSFVGPQYIYHLACPGSPRVYLPRDIETLSASALATKNVLDLAVRYRSRIIIGSDTAVYGLLPEATSTPVEEYHGPIDYLAPEYHYAESKRFAETLTEAYRTQYSLETKIVRIFGAYGPRIHLEDGRLIAHLVSLALTNKQIVIPKEVSSVSMCYVDDMVSGLEKIMALDGAGIYNLGSNVRYKPSELVQKIIALTKSRSKVVAGDLASLTTEVRHAWEQHEGNANINKVKEQAGWFPLIVLDEGLKTTIDYMKSLRSVSGIVH